MITQSTVILPTAYHPSILYFVALHHAPEVVIDIYEHYYKQTYRNRAVIASVAGKQALSVPIVMGRSLRIPVNDIKISYTDHWQHVHLRAIDTIYHNAPFFDIVFSDIKKIITTNYTYLWQLNDTLLHYYLSLLNLSVNFKYSKDYIESEKDMLDLRKQYSPKINYIEDYPFLKKIYYQGNLAKEQFIPDLSILDLIMNLGHEAGYYIRTII